MNLYGKLASVPPHDLPRTLQSFFVVRESHQVLEGGHATLWGELDIGRFPLNGRRWWHRCCVPLSRPSSRRDTVNAETANKREKLVVVWEQAKAIESLIITCIYRGVSVFSSLTEAGAFFCESLGQKGLERRMTGLSRKTQDSSEGQSSFSHARFLVGNHIPIVLVAASTVLKALQTEGHNVKTKCISTSGSRHPHKEESLLRASKRDPTHHFVVGKRTRTGLDSNHKTHQ